MIVDDEPLARRVLEKYIGSLPSLELITQCCNALEAAAFLHREKVDLIFLDIQMPELTGMDFLKTLTDPPAVILTTAYPQYALEGYEYSVVDYLLKPIAFDRFLKSVNKVIDKKSKEAGYESKPATSGGEKLDDFVFLKADKKNHKVFYSDILFIEGCGNYIKVYTTDKTLIVSERMTAVEQRLPSHLFVRIHKSYIISIHHIRETAENKVKVDDKWLPVGNMFKIKMKELIDPLTVGKR
jgi:DNA-binding LytR/AlgR family response regulator